MLGKVGKSRPNSDWELAKVVWRRPWPRVAKIALAGVGVFAVVPPVQLLVGGPISQHPPFEIAAVTLIMQTVFAVLGFGMAYSQRRSATCASTMGQLTVLAHRPATVFRANMVGPVQSAIAVFALLTPMTAFVAAYVGVELATFARLTLCVLALGACVVTAIVLSDVYWGKSARAKAYILTSWVWTFVGLVGFVCLSGFPPVADLTLTVWVWFTSQTVLQWVLAIGGFASACVALWRTLQFADVHYLDWRAGALEAAEEVRGSKQRPPVLFHPTGTRPSRTLRSRFPFAEAAWLGRIHVMHSRLVVGGLVAAVIASTAILSALDPQIVMDGADDGRPSMLFAGMIALVTAEMLAVVVVLGPIHASQWITSEASADRLELLALTRPLQKIVRELLVHALLTTTALAAVATLAYWLIALQLRGPLDPRWVTPALLLGVPICVAMIALISLGVSLRWPNSGSGTRLVVGLAAILIGPLTIWLTPHWIQRGLLAIESEPATYANARREALVRERLSA